MYYSENKAKTLSERISDEKEVVILLESHYYVIKVVFYEKKRS